MIIDWSEAPEGADAYLEDRWYKTDDNSKQAWQWLDGFWSTPGRLMYENLMSDHATQWRPATTTQIGGDHYSRMAIQPIEYILANGLGYCEGNVIKYVSRYKAKGGVEDLRKARHYIDMLIEQESD